MSQTPQERFVDDQHRYRLDSRIATGGMGEVWRATDTALGRVVAIKVLKNEYADDPQFRIRFETEARHAASLHHPHVASVYDVGESRLLGEADGSHVPRPFLVMELVDGQPLSALLRGGRPLDPEVARDLMAQAADAIGAAHRAGIVHRDVKPANLMVTPERQVKITDFGIARASDGLGLTGTGQVMGTPQYLSPEQARGNPATPASDVYSLGVVAFECLVGRRPFDAESPVATALAHLNDPVPSLPATVPPDLAAVVRRALSKRPEERFADGTAFAAALRDPRAATAATVVAASPTVPGRVPDGERTQVLGAVPVDPLPTPVAEPVELAREPTDRRAAKGSPWPIVLLVLALIATVVLIVALVVQGSGDDADPDATQTPSSEPASSDPTTEDTPSEPSETAPETFDLDEDDYLGRDLDEVLADLRQLNLNPDPQAVDNPGDEDPETVANVDPTSGLSEGDRVTVEFYREAEPSEEPTPTEEPSEEPTPSQTPSQEPSQEPSGEPSPSAGATPSTDGGTPSTPTPTGGA